MENKTITVEVEIKGTIVLSVPEGKTVKDLLVDIQPDVVDYLDMENGHVVTANLDFVNHKILE